MISCVASKRKEKFYILVRRNLLIPVSFFRFRTPTDVSNKSVTLDCLINVPSFSHFLLPFSYTKVVKKWSLTSSEFLRGWVNKSGKKSFSVNYSEKMFFSRHSLFPHKTKRAGHKIC